MVRFKVIFFQTPCSTHPKLSNKNRWLLVEFIDISPVDTSSKAGIRPLDGKQVYNALRDSVTTNFGDAGWGAVGMSLTGVLILTIAAFRFSTDHFTLR